MFWTPAILAKATGGELLSGNPDALVETISTDTRKIASRHCFIALAGENHDGHAFVADAIGRGAGAVIVSEWRGMDLPGPEGAAVIKVRDTLHALGELARFHRARFDIPVIAVTGSNGKTSTKEMIAAIFGRNRTVLKNRGNFNNLIGLPLTLLELNAEHRVAVVEMGINVPGEMERLARIGSPSAGVITNVQPAHLEGLQSLDRILEEKGKLWEALGGEGLAVVNRDDARLRRLGSGVAARRITYSFDETAADVHLASPVLVSEGKTTFRIGFRGAGLSISLPVMGLHYARNALAAAAAAFGMGADAAEVQAGLSSYEPICQRMELRRFENGCVVIDDSYNANPGSMLAAVETVRAANPGRPFVAVLGEMRELGPEGPLLHFELGKKIGAGGLGGLITLGHLGVEIQKGALAAGMDKALCIHAGDHQEAVALLLDRAPECAWILVKGSRAMAMEKIVEGICGKWR